MAEIFLEWKPGAINGLSIKKYLNGNFGVFLEPECGKHKREIFLGATV